MRKRERERVVHRYARLDKFVTYAKVKKGVEKVPRKENNNFLVVFASI